MFLGLLESLYKSDHDSFALPCPAYTEAVYTREYLLVTHPRVCAAFAYMGKYGLRLEYSVVSNKPKSIQLRSELKVI
jgi:hypothetical protein